MDDGLRRLDDPSNTKNTLLTLPLSDFPGNAAAAAKNDDGTQDEDEDDGGLILISLPSTSNNGGLTMDDLLRGESVYILGETSEKDICNDDNAVPAAEREENGGSGIGGSIEPVAARLIVEGKAISKNINGCSGKTMELTRVETSNTYIVVPPMPMKKNAATDANVDDEKDDGSNKRQKIASSKKSSDKKDMIAMPSRSIGLVPGEDSPACFFLDPSHLQPGHFASKLRGSLSRWMYDPFDPPSTESAEGEGSAKIIFGYTIPELAHICRTSQSEIEYAVHNRVFGAEDALAIPSSNNSDSTTTTSTSIRYGMLSEEGRQTVSTSIVSALLESDLDLAWKHPSSSSVEKKQHKGVQLKLLMEEIRTHWHRLEGNGEGTSSRGASSSSQVANPYLTNSQTDSQSQFGTPSQFPTTPAAEVQLANEVIWHCLRPILHYKGIATKDTMPDEAVQLIPDEVAKLAAHSVFLGGAPRSTGVGSSAVWWEEGELMEAWSMRLPSVSSKYEPRTELLSGIAISEIKETDDDDGGMSDSQPIRRWQYLPEAGLPLVPSLRIKSMFALRDAWTLKDAVPYLEKFITCDKEGDEKGLHSMVAALLEKYAKAIKLTEKDVDGKDVSVTRYVAVPN